MKSCKSQKNIEIITEQNCQKQLNKSKSISSLGSTRNSRPIDIDVRRDTNSKQIGKIKSQSCRNIDLENKKLFKSRQSTQKIQSRQNSGLSSSLFSDKKTLDNNDHRKQLDTLCLQRILCLIKKYLIEKRQIWNFGMLSYHQLITILFIVRYTHFVTQQEFLRQDHHQQLKKIYSLWLSISIKKHFNMQNLMNIICAIENLEANVVKIETQLEQIQLELSQQEGMKYYVDTCTDPQYIFFIKKLVLTRNQNGSLELTSAEKEKIATFYNTFKLNRLKNTSAIECVRQEEQPEHQLVSKKSRQLAEEKRKKITEKIKSKNPEVSSINLHDLLVFRERDYMPKSKTIIQLKTNMNSSSHQKKKIKKEELEYLSRPKRHLQEKVCDEIQFQRNRNQYTFQPKISQYSGNSSRLKPQQKTVKNAQKVVLRMKQARKMKSNKQNILQKGWPNHISHQSEENKKTMSKKKNFNSFIPNNYLDYPLKKGDFSEKLNSIDSLTLSDQSMLEEQQNNQDHKLANTCSATNEQSNALAEKLFDNTDNNKSDDKNDKLQKYEVNKDYLKIPLLYIDVNIEEGRKQRIIVYDNDRADKLAMQFAKKHGLNEETMTKLEMLLQQQMDTVLSRIDEETEDQCSYII